MPQVLQSSPDAAAQAAELVQPLLKVLADGLSKPVMRGDGLAALLALSLIAAADSSARTAVSKEKARSIAVLGIEVHSKV